MSLPYTRTLAELAGEICLESYSPADTKPGYSMVFVHGNFCGSWCFKYLMDHFARQGIPCHGVNLRGHWLSGNHAGLGTFTPSDYVQDVLSCLDFIGGDVVLLGHSMGGVIGQKVAEQKQLAGLVLLDSAPCKEITVNYFRPDPAVNELLAELMVVHPDGTISLHKDPEKITQLFFEAGQVSNETLRQTVAFLGRESARVLKEHALMAVDADKVQCPVAVIGRSGHGNEKNPDLWHAIADYYNAENRFISKGMGHGMFLQGNWREFADKIQSWF